MLGLYLRLLALSKRSYLKVFIRILKALRIQPILLKTKFIGYKYIPSLYKTNNGDISKLGSFNRN
jgi:hypothetical protein